MKTDANALRLIVGDSAFPLEPAPVLIRRAFLQGLRLRLDFYRASFIEKATATKEDAESKPILHPEVPESERWPMLKGRAIEILKRIETDYVVAGRGEILDAFLGYMNNSPPPDAIKQWFSHLAVELHRETIEVEEKTVGFAAGLDARARVGHLWVRDAELLARERGMNRGKVAEFMTLHEETKAYYAELEAVPAPIRAGH